MPEWKWDMITLDFITGLPISKKKNDSIMVVVDKLRKVFHFIPIKSTFKTAQIADIFMKEVFRLHGICILETSLYSIGYTNSVKYYIPSKNRWEN